MIWIIESDLPHEFYFYDMEELECIRKTLWLISEELMVQYIGMEGDEHVAVIYIEEDIEDEI